MTSPFFPKKKNCVVFGCIIKTPIGNASDVDITHIHKLSHLFFKDEITYGHIYTTTPLLVVVYEFALKHHLEIAPIHTFVWS